jgi:hypothetical protein
VTAQINSRLATQIDVNHQANCVVKVTVANQSIDGLEQQNAQSVGTEQSLDADPHRGIVINDENGFLFGQDGQPLDANRSHAPACCKRRGDHEPSRPSISRAAARSKNTLSPFFYIVPWDISVRSSKDVL